MFKSKLSLVIVVAMLALTIFGTVGAQGGRNDCYWNGQAHPEGKTIYIGGLGLVTCHQGSWVPLLITPPLPLDLKEKLNWEEIVPPNPFPDGPCKCPPEIEQYFEDMLKVATIYDKLDVVSATDPDIDPAHDLEGYADWMQTVIDKGLGR